MPDGFSTLIDTSNAFFTELAANNTKDWFTERKDHYTSEIRKPAELLAELLSEDIARLTGIAHKPKLFRIHRDVRFSKDKTPYNAHLHLMWAQPTDPRPVWFFGSSPDYLILGMGLMGLKADSLTRYRNFIDTKGAEVSQAIAASGAEISDWGPEPLKRVPKPFEQDHPHAALLKRKALAINMSLPSDWRETGLIKSCQTMMNAYRPCWSLMNAAIS